MKFLLNMNLPRKLGDYLIDKEHEARHAGNVGMFKSPDIDIVKHARLNDEVIITHDLDYGNILAFSKEQKPSVIIFRIRNTTVENLFNNLIKVLADIENELRQGSIVIIEDAAVRILSQK